MRALRVTVKHSAGRWADVQLKPENCTPGVVWVFWCMLVVCAYTCIVYTQVTNPVCGQGSARGPPGGHQEPVRGHPSLDPSPLYFLRQGSLTTWSSPSWLGQLGRCPHTSLLVLSPPPSSEIRVCTTYPASLRNKTTQEACYSGPRLYRWHGPVI